MVLIPEGFRESLIYFNSRDLISNTDIDVVPGDDDDVISGHTLDDVLLGLGGDDRIVANEGNDIVAGDAGNDTLVGGAGRDTLLGGDGDDYVDGGAGNDSILGEAGNDELIGRGGNDEFDGGTGNDNIRGGAGFDQAHYNSDILTDTGEFNFEFARLGNSSGWITDTNTADGDLGTDLLQSIEQLKFDDFNVFLNGTNNEIIAFDDAVETDEDNSVTFNVLDNDVDFDVDFLGLVDDDDIVSVDDTGLMGSLMVDFETGDITYDPGAAFQFLAEGEIATESFTYIATDSSGTTSEATVEVTIIGVNDQPTVMDAMTTTSEDEASVVFSLNDLSDDVDLTDILSFEVFGPDELQGSVDFDAAAGTLTFNLDGQYQFLDAGESEVIEFQFRAIDDSGTDNDTSEIATLTVIIEGNDDRMDETIDASFSTSDQELFNVAPGAQVTLNLAPFGASFSAGQFFGLPLGPFSAGIDVSIDGELSIQPVVRYTNEGIDATIDLDVVLTLPTQVEEGQTITIDSSFGDTDFDILADGGTFELALNLLGSLTGGVNFVIPVLPDIGFDFLNIDLATLFFDTGVMPISGLDFGGAGSIGVGSPTQDFVFSSLAGSGSFSDALFDFNVDLAEAFASLVPIPGFTFRPEINIDGPPIILPFPPFVGPPSFEFDAFIDFLSVNLLGTIDAVREFSLDLNGVRAVFIPEDGDPVEFMVGQSFEFTIPEGFDTENDGVFDYTIALDINGDGESGILFSQLFEILSNFDASLEALSGGASFDVPLLPALELEIGPLINIDLDNQDPEEVLASLANDTNLSLLGFNSVEEDFSIDASLFNDSGLMLFV